METKTTVIVLSPIVTVGAIASSQVLPAPVDAACSGNPHDFDSGTNGNPHDSENGNLENGNSHDLLSDFHHHQAEDCPGAK